ncbi:2-oxo-4-hydroxy-4-carboxy-5-ureidoimidazoline decarboxylase [Gayadomonas joobiniege]|uniref:2-oxo-4-hydroxy-4-carboxy-5-ureidoimidazoline decarboxylase n=1 Tax=Gayadomonas joobiniege TaxID=1234606 RepID=UPI00035DDCE8|nr:2-oxo-4-hydroxy-4-carboxy-5-ureidoimidazoline decarboxylase [Gayadomonas joobiniege]
MTLEDFNVLPEAAARQTLTDCCSATQWVSQMLAKRPFTNVGQFHDTSAKIWRSCTETDYLQAFEGHPQIGNMASLKAKYARSASLCNHEQSSMQQADEELIQQMADLNQAYLKKFGFIYIVYASDKSPQQMLSLLKERLTNSRAIELKIAAAEQYKITHLRINKLLGLI